MISGSLPFPHLLGFLGPFSWQFRSFSHGFYQGFSLLVLLGQALHLTGSLSLISFPFLVHWASFFPFSFFVIWYIIYYRVRIRLTIILNLWILSSSVNQKPENLPDDGGGGSCVPLQLLLLKQLLTACLSHQPLSKSLRIQVHGKHLTYAGDLFSIV